MKSGPSPQPTNLRILRGDPGRRAKQNPAEPRPKVSAPEPPAWLDSTARTEWKRIVPLLLAVRCIAESDLAVLSSYCLAWSRYRKATLAIQRHGITMECPQGTLRRPEVAIAAEAERALIRAAGELGLSPAARTRVHAGAADGAQDEAKAFLGY